MTTVLCGIRVFVCLFVYWDIYIEATLRESLSLTSVFPPLAYVLGTYIPPFTAF